MNPSNDGLENAATLNQPDDQHDDGHDDEDVDEISQVRVVRAPEAEAPEQDEQHDDGLEHGAAALHGFEPNHSSRGAPRSDGRERGKKGSRSVMPVTRTARSISHRRRACERGLRVGRFVGAGHYDSQHATARVDAGQIGGGALGDAGVGARSFSFRYVSRLRDSV